MDYNFRIAEFQDLEEIVFIYNQSIPKRIATADTIPLTVEQRIGWFHEHKPQKHPIYIIESIEGIIVGWLSFSAFKNRPAYDETSEISIYIKDEFQFLGIGKKALSFAIELAPSLEIYNILGIIFSHNVPSINMFKNQGFKQWGFLPDVTIMDGKYYSVTIMGIKLNK